MNTVATEAKSIRNQSSLSNLPQCTSSRELKVLITLRNEGLISFDEIELRGQKAQHQLFVNCKNEMC